MSDGTLRFDGRVVVVTGGGRGVGRACAELLAARGARVVVNDTGGDTEGRTGGGATGGADDTGATDDTADRDLADRVAGELVAAGGQAVGSTHDTSTPAGARALVGLAEERFGPVDVVVANAGISWSSPLATVTPDELERSFAVNAGAPLWLVQAVWESMSRRGYGRIVTVASAGVFGYPGRVHYVMAKAAVLGLTRSIALEGHEHGIVANCVLPWAHTRMAAARDDAAERWLAEHIPPGAVAAGIGWLAHEACTTTGEVFGLEGGRMARVVLGAGPGLVDLDPTPEAFGRGWDQVMAVEPLATPPDTGRYVSDVVRPALRAARRPTP